MPSFSFAGGVSRSQSGPSGTDLSLDATDLGVTFQLSTTSNPGGNSLIYSGATGAFTMIDSAGGAYTLRATANTGGSGMVFDGAGLSLDLGAFRTGVWDITFIDVDSLSNLTFTGINTTASVINIDPSETRDFSGIRFTLSSGFGAMSFDGLSANMVCYLEGTGIATPSGRRKVEDLRAGDLVLTADGRSVEVQWMGIRPVVPRFFDAEVVNPICIRAGALGADGPDRDLMVSPEHAIGLAGTLINAAALVNGQTIFQVARMPRLGFSYYHIETRAHELLLAEGLPAESYVDTVGPKAFANGSDRPERPMVPEMDVPRITTKRMIPPSVQARLASDFEAALTSLKNAA